MDTNKLYAIYGQDGRAMARQALSQIDAKSLIPDAHATIAIKPNLVVARPAEDGATTHASVVEGIIEYLFENGYKNVSIIESSWVGDSTRRAFDACGYRDLSRRTGVPLYDLKSDESVARSADGLALRICRRAAEAMFLINVPVLKAHCQTLFTCALKNLKGIIPDQEKRRYHTLGIHRPVAALNAAIRPHLTVVDALCGDLTFEEGGNPVPMDRLLIGCDPVLIDSYGAALIGLSPQEVDYIPMAARLGVGRMYAGDELIELNSAQSAPRKIALSRRAQRLLRGVNEDQACSACVGSLVHALNRLDNDGLLGRIREPIHIGQGYRGKTAEGLGVGVCCRGCTFSVAGCPPSASDVVEFLRARAR